MAEQEASTPYSTLIYLGAGARLPLEACEQTAANVWLVEASRTQAQKLRRAAEGHAGIKVKEAVVAAQPGLQNFYEYNLPWASGLKPPEERLQRLYPGLRCLASEPREGLGIGELVERCLSGISEAGSEQGVLLVIDLGDQASELLQALEEAGSLARFDCIAVVPPYRQGVDLLAPSSLHGPLPLPKSLDWLAEGSRCYQPHPLLQKLQQATENNRQLTHRLAQQEERQAESDQHQQILSADHDQLRQQLEERTQERDSQCQQREELANERDQLRQQLEERTRQRDNQHQQHEELANERDQLRQQLEERTRQRDNQHQQREELANERDQLRQQLEERTRQRDNQHQQREELANERDQLRQQLEERTQEYDELKRQAEELEKQREHALHQNHLNHEALEAERDTAARLKEEYDALVRERDAALQHAEQQQLKLHQEQQQRQQLVEQEMLKAEAQLDLVREILTEGKDF